MPTAWFNGYLRRFQQQRKSSKFKTLLQLLNIRNTLIGENSFELQIHFTILRFKKVK